jgi:hypothetical protein
MSPDECRPVDVTVDGQTETIRVHGGAPMGPDAATAMSVLVQAVRDRVATAGVSMRQAALQVMREHWPAGGQCRCGKSAVNATLWSVHMLQALAEAGVLLPLDQRMADQP